MYAIRSYYAAEPAKNAPVVTLYNPAGKRDPFVPFIKVMAKAVRGDLSSLPPLQRYDLGELKFVGVIWGAGLRKALVEDAEGKGYTVGVGMKIGSSGGVVTRITEEEIVVREAFRDYTGGKIESVITSYSIHYTKLYEIPRAGSDPSPAFPPTSRR